MAKVGSVGQVCPSVVEHTSPCMRPVPVAGTTVSVTVEANACPGAVSSTPPPSTPRASTAPTEPLRAISQRMAYASFLRSPPHTNCKQSQQPGSEQPHGGRQRHDAAVEVHTPGQGNVYAI